jgi:hypothetical protein
MSIDKYIEEVKSYLQEWINLDKYPNQFMGLDITNLNLEDEKSLVYTIGTHLYSTITGEKYQDELTHKDIKLPRVYQFLNMVLKKNRDERESNPDFLLSVLESEDRDLIEDKKTTDRYIIECLSTVGLTRLRNQDYLGCYEFDNALALIVADGVGGAESGEIASQITTEFVLESLKKYDLTHESNIQEILREIIFEANQNVLEYAKRHNMGRMGTTLSLALIIEQDTLYIAHIGDSRIYEYNRGKNPRPITQDHSEIEILIREGKVKEEDKAKKERK